MADDDVERALSQALRDPGEWLDRAQQLKRAADVLFEGFRNDVARFHGLTSFEEMPTGVEVASNDARGHLAAYSLGPVYLMVAGYAFENLAKGLIVARDKSDSTITKITTRHLSKELLETAEVALTDRQADLVERMAVHVKWSGRYPVPTRAEDLARAREPRLWESVRRVSTGDGRLVDTLFERMQAEFEMRSRGVIGPSESVSLDAE